MADAPSIQTSLVQQLRQLEADMLTETGPPHPGWVRRRQEAVMLALDIGRHGDAMGYGLRALDLANTLQDPAMQARAHMLIALIYSDNYDAAEAEQHFELARDLARRHDDRGMLGRVVTNRAHHLLHGHDLHAAYRELVTHAALMSTLDEVPLLAAYHINLVTACACLCEEHPADPQVPEWQGWLRRSLTWLEARSMDELPLAVQLDILEVFARVALLQGEHARALQFARERTELARQADSAILLASAYRQLGDVHAAQRDWPDAVAAYGEALGISEAQERHVTAMELREALAAAHAQSGDYEAAYRVQRAGVQLGRLMEQILRQRAQIGAVERQALESDLRARFYREASERDFLTGVANRAQAMQVLDRLQQGLDAGEVKAVAVAIFDLDHFKDVNDRYGHDVGDQVLVGVAQRVQHVTRDQDLLSRHGGEEFLLILQETSLQEALRICDRLRLHVADLQFPAWPELRVTASFGVSPMQPGRGVQWALRQADVQLYRSKHAGRNRVTGRDAPAPPDAR
ncbi:GGDEF domain-containing protein [Deinococcus aquiradiocola]|uniref:GGDEF domain-containing protein n=1 Tax=Deinococcus aquiradiocola TaxID=393059 RepID=A0A917PRT5_9DEIO|nr:GGDEF domain-containing protein [Deinococcus aquiradiocola]GGJ88673.1 hypothetical protein GCM10008939_35950 [Deinococcus aquiradiocola]